MAVNMNMPGTKPLNVWEDEEERKRQEEERRKKEEAQRLRELQSQVAAAEPVKPKTVQEAVQTNQQINAAQKAEEAYKPIASKNSNNVANLQPVETQPQTATQMLRWERDPSKTEKWYKGETPTNREIQAQIYRINQQNPERAQYLWQQYQTIQQDPTSAIYNPYSKGTNQALSALAKLGYDVGNGVTEEWLNENQGLLQHLKYTAAGNIQAPSRRSSKEEQAAYYYVQLLQDEDKTKQAELEWKALQEELMYWAKRDDLNMTDDEIINKIDWSQYKTLSGMKDNWSAGNPTSLNRAIGYDEDNMYGVIWAARNGADPNDPLNAVRYTLGQGVQYQFDQDKYDRRDPKSSKYAPYSTATLTGAARYFGVSEFSREWCTENRDYRLSDDATALEMFDTVYRAEQTTEKAEDELAELKKNIERRLSHYSDPDKIINSIDWGDYPTLKKMQDTLAGGEILMTTRGVDFDWEAMQDDIRQQCLDKNWRRQGARYVQDVFSKLTGDLNQTLTDARDAANTTRGNNINAAGPTLLENGTPAEHTAAIAGYSPTQNADMMGIADGIDDDRFDANGVYNYTLEGANQLTFQNYLPAHDVITRYDAAEQEAAEAQRRIDLLNQGILPDEYDAQQEEKPDTSGSLLNQAREAGAIVTGSAGASSATFLPSNRTDYGLPPQVELSSKEKRALDAAGIKDTTDPKLTVEQRQVVREILAAHDIEFPKSEEELAYEEEIRRQLNIAQAKLDEANATMEELRDQNEEARKTVQEVNDAYEAVDLAQGLTGEQSHGYQMKSMMDAYYAWGAEYEPTQWSAYNMYDYALREGESPEAVAQAAQIGKAQNEEELRRINTVIKYLEDNGYEFDDQYKENVQRRIDSLQRDIDAADYYMMRNSEDFDAVVQAQINEIGAADEETLFLATLPGAAVTAEVRDLAIANPELLQNRGKLPMTDEEVYYIQAMTDEERKTYLYIKGKQGDDAAKKYYDYLTDPTYGVINTRLSEEYQAEFAAFGAEHPVAGTVLSIIMSPFGAAGAVYSGWQKITGGEISPYNAAMLPTIAKSAMRGTARQELSSWASQQFGEGSLGQKIMEIGYDGITSALDSIVNGATYGGVSLGEATTGLGKFGLKALESLVTASPMGAQAMSNAIWEAKMDGLSDEKALMMGAMTFVCETITEAITFDNMAESFELGKSGGAKQWLTNIATKYLDEPLAEAVNEYMEAKGEEWILGQDSEIQRRIAELTPELGAEGAKAQATKELWERVGMAAITGALSSQVSTGVGYVAGKVRGQNITPEQRETTVEQRENVAEPDTSDNSIATAQQTAERVQQVDENGNVVEPDTSDNSIAQTQQVADRIQQVDENGNVAEPTTSDNSVAEAQQVAERQQQVEQRGNVVEPTTPVNDPKRLVKQMTALNMAVSADEAAQGATIGAVLLPKGKRDLLNGAFASAAGQYLVEQYGGPEAVTKMRKILQTAHAAGMNTEVINGAVKTAALADPGTLSNAAMQVVMENGPTALNLEILQQTVAQELQNPVFATSVKQKTMNHLVANFEMKHIANGELASVAPYEQNLENAQREQQNAQEALSREEQTQTEMQKTVEQAHNEFINNPGDEVLKNSLIGARNDLEGQLKVVEEYVMRKNNADAATQQAKAQLDQKRDEALAPIREQATQEAQAAIAAEQQQQTAAAQQVQAARQVQAIKDAAKTAAVATVAQEMTDYQNAVKKLPPKIPFGMGAQAKTTRGQNVMLTGIAYTDGYTNYYTASNGKVYSQNALRDGQQLFDQASDSFTDEQWDELDNSEAPTVPLEQSITVKDGRGKKHEVVGLMSADPNSEAIHVMYADGKTGDWTNLQPVKTADGNIIDELYDQNLDKLNKAWKDDTKETTSENVTPGTSEARGELPNAQSTTQATHQTPKSGQEILGNLATGLGMQAENRLKKYLRNRRNTTRGYTYNNGIVHVLDAQDVKAGVHEIGHNLDVQMNMRAMFPDLNQLRQNYEQMYGTGFLNQYTPQEVPGELMAEFTRTWLQDRDSAVALSSEEIVRNFETALREHGYLDAMKEAQTEFKVYDEASAVEREKAMIKMDAKEKERQSIADRAKNFATKWADGTIQFLDLTNAVKRAQGDQFNYADDTRTLLLANPNVIGNFADSTLFGSGMVDPQGNPITNEATGENYGSLSDIFEKVDRKDQEDFVALWAALHARDRNRVGKDVFTRDVNTDEVIDTLSKAHKDWLDVIDKFEDWYGAFMQNWLVNTGRLSQQAFNTMRRMYPHYLPTFRTTDNTTARNGAGRTTDAVPQNGVRRAVGSTQNIDNPIAHIAEYVQSYIANMKQVEALRAFDAQMRYLMENHLDGSALAEPAQHDMEMEYRGRANAENRQAVETALNGLQAVGHISDHDAQIVMDFMSEIPDTGFVMSDHATGNDVVSIPMEDGSVHSWTVYNPEIVKALMRTSNPNQIPVIARALGKITRFLCSNATSRSMPFVVQNFASDTETAANTGRGGLWSKTLPVYAAKQVTTAFKLLGDEIAGTAVGKTLNLHESEDYRQFRLFGQLGHRYTFKNSESREELSKKLFGGKKSTGEIMKRILRSPITGIENLSEFFEDVTRYNEFLHSGDDRSTYEGRLRAGQNSREATTDFSKRGTAETDIAFVNGLIPFFNASLQGVYKTARMFSSENEGNRIKTLARIGVNSILTSAIIAAVRGMTWNDEDKEAFEQLSDYERSRYWHIKLPSGKFFRIKRSQDGLVQIADAIGDFIGKVFTGYEGDELGSLAGIAREVANNVMIDVGTSLAPFIDASNNKTWYGGQIEDYRMQQMSTGARYDEDMRISTRALSYLFNLAGLDYSPLDVEYIENQFLGSMGSLASGFFDVLTGDEITGEALLSVVTDHLSKKFLVDPVYTNRLSSTFYDGKTRLENIVNEGKAGKTPEYFRYDLTQEEIDKAYADASKLTSSSGAIGKAYSEIQKLWSKHDKIMEDENLTQAEREAKAREYREQINALYLQANAEVADFWNTYGYSNGLEQTVLNMVNLFTNKKGDGIEQLNQENALDDKWNTATTVAAKNQIAPEYMKWATEMREATGKDSMLPHPVRVPEFNGAKIPVESAYWKDYIFAYNTAYNAYLDKKNVDWSELTDKEREKLLNGAHSSANNAARKWLKDNVPGFDE